MKVYELMAVLGDMTGSSEVKVSNCMTLAEIASREDPNLTGEGDRALYDCGGKVCDVYFGEDGDIVFIGVEV